MNMTQTLTREVPHAGNFASPVNGDTYHHLAVQLIGTSGGLTDVMLAFSGLGIAVERLEFTRTSAESARLEVRFHADRRMADLLRRKLARLLDVLSLE